MGLMDFMSKIKNTRITIRCIEYRPGLREMPLGLRFGGKQHKELKDRPQAHKGRLI